MTRPLSKSERRAVMDALRDMKRSGVRTIDIRQLPVGASVLKISLQGVRR